MLWRDNKDPWTSQSCHFSSFLHRLLMLSVSRRRRALSKHGQGSSEHCVRPFCIRLKRIFQAGACAVPSAKSSVSSS